MLKRQLWTDAMLLCVCPTARHLSLACALFCSFRFDIPCFDGGLQTLTGLDDS